MDYRQAVDYLLSLSDFERGGRFQDRPDVRPMLSLLRRLSDPHLGPFTTHIAGSKGKGSVAAMLDSILRAAGLHSGLYTSPHLHSYCERIRIGGEPIAEETFARLTEQLHEAANNEEEPDAGRHLVTFDLVTALAFLAFQARGVQIQVLETGLGGRVDSTNVFQKKDVCIISPISLEHTAILGDTIEAIAGEKAAIIRPGSAVVMAPQAHEDAVRVVRRTAAEASTSLVEVARQYRWQRLSHDPHGQRFRLEGPQRAIDLTLPLLGEHQMENAATAVAAADALSERGPAISSEAIVHGLASVSWPGRLEVLRQSPLVIADGAHNRDSTRRLRQALDDYFSLRRAVFIIGTSTDKDVNGLAEELAPIAASVIATRSYHPRAMPPKQIATAFARLGVAAETAASTEEALTRAVAVEGSQEVICLTGSLFVVAEGREHILGVAAQR